MPELPEVETIRTLLEKHLIGRRILSCDLLYANVLKSPISSLHFILNSPISKIRRKGKLLMFCFENGVTLLSHLRMEGKYYLYDESEENSRYARVVFHLDHNEKLCYDDSRKFGVMKVVKNKVEEDPWITALGSEPFDLDDGHLLYQKARDHKIAVKSFIMDQHILAGLGNIYADETLFLSHIHPETPAHALSLEEWNLILKNAKEVLHKAIELGGSTIRSYHAGRNLDGLFQNELLVYGKEGMPCPHCHQTLEKIMVNGRGTTFCPHCQKNKARPFVLGITGAIGSGKSTALQMFHSFGAETLSADQVTYQLYQNKMVQKRIQSFFSTPIFINQQLNKTAFRHALKEDKKGKEKFDSYFYPLVKKEMLSFIRKAKTKVVALEIPLLFPYGFDALCDATLAIKISNQQQKDNLSKRHQEEIDKMLALNYASEDFPYIDRLTYYIDANNNKKTLRRALQKIYQELINTHTL